MTLIWDGTQKSWDGTHKWGVDTVPVAVQTERDILGRGVVKRVACFEIYSVDPETLVFGTKLPLRQKGGNRHISGRNRMQQDGLEFILNDPTRRYLPDGDLHDLVAINSLVGVKWLVGNGIDELEYYGNVYRIVEPPNREHTAQGQSPFVVNAEDWLRSPLDYDTFYIGGITPLREAILLKDDMLALGCPVVGSSNSWATIAGAILFYLAGERLRVTGNWVSPEHPTGDVLTEMLDPLVVQSLSRAPSWWDVFNFCAWLGRVQAVYDGDGWPHIRESHDRIDSGLYIGCESNIGRISVPWENPVSRDITRPAFTSFSYYITYVEELASGPVIHLDFLAQKFSNARNNPHVEPAGRGSVEIARGNFVHEAGTSAMNYVADVLQRTLSAADTVTVPVDNAFPASKYIMQDVTVDLPDYGIEGSFRLNEINQPLDERVATLILNWTAD